MTYLLNYVRMKMIVAYLVAGWAIAPFITWIEKYVYSDWEFLKFLFVIISLDTVLGIYKAILRRNISSKAFGMLFRKIIVYCGALVATSVLVRFTVDGGVQAAFRFMDNVVFSAIMLREVISIFENIGEIEPDALPKWILKHLKRFDSITGKKIIDEK